jgi:short-subunit dehydrogenase
MQELEPYGIKPIKLDVTKDENLLECVNQIYREAGSIDVLVNCAGLGSYGALEDVPMKEARNQMEINLFATARLIQLVLPGMRANKFGKIVNISSVGGKVGLPMGSWYHASKFAVEGLSDTLRNEVRQFGIDVIVIEPAATKSEMIENGSKSLAQFSGRTVYKELANGITKAYESMAKSALEPVEIAKLIQKGIEAKYPKARYMAKNARPFLWMRKLLPDRVFDKMLMSQMK